MKYKKSLGRIIAIGAIFLFIVLTRYLPSDQKDVSGHAAWVKRVIDGDTIVLGNNERVRYIGVNTPETHHPKKGIEYYGPEAADFNKKLVLGKNVRLEFDVEKYDKYGRTLAYVYLGDGIFVNAELVKLGYARVMSIRPNTRYSELFKRLQQEAKTKRLGLWAK
ncbi:MAG: hypothetical protein COW11_00515 [Candidatus Omnitrophica bacterium CG12_big_fil_rev_8_21_14_0_65_43_15]|uniref:TNase-like domain-containing protein n=1 Tax=Candidatus Taenaricola geysiri TaxID=1974752 RepID=A0A2J0LN10_9BACT|nr:MAG: hypothetical protein AUJ89_01780 [Candidatus Omnitrophica bacterium CG1_02_43_210]PIV11819.1 MAG: hypothetical protein COS48_03995 [Candidatus Omnitrophica bacterium CG03_land_8_20_14_0_80_43_22]PIW66963.1 MAG: hypothetical protein COW11_00515 [Candidatus Omnitrophica bacterium CG12_big_fil_rev_8_21_14_0_65_43_15]PIW79901.1 MAG: hypothetical protein COZ98_05100 [Candidatus Omnitrophica bacterium CG_4_8_14_3_um_filter_43_15]PIY83388.1 MAG: hypothetical protein COY77_05575 [Candidatus Omn